MNKSRFVYVIYAVMFTLLCTPVKAITLGHELVADPYFDDPLSWDVGIGSSFVENGYLVVINHSGLIFPDPKIVTTVDTTYQYALSVDFVNNLSGGGKVTVGGQTIWEPSYDTGLFTGTIVATDTAGLVFNFLTPYLGRAEFDSVSIKAILATPLPQSVWLFMAGLQGLVAVAMSKVA